jgi:hypothetical protein
LHQHQRVQRVAVRAETVVDEAVVSRILGGGEQHAIEPDAAALVVHLVLVALPLGDLDGDVELHSRDGSAVRQSPAQPYNALFFLKHPSAEQT